MQPTAARVRDLLHYDPETGHFAWKVTRGSTARAGAQAGSITNNGYRTICVDGSPILAHRLAWLYVHGALPVGALDHSNNDRLDNRIGNLRIADGSQNLANSRRRVDNTAGVKGVSFHRRSGRWQARLKVRGTRIQIGLFDSPEAAHVAYLKAAKEHFGEFARAA